MQYSDNQFRRFTFFLETDSKENIRSFLHKELPNEIFNLEEYRKENQSFYILDTSPEMNFSDVKKVFTIPLFETQPLERIYELEQKEIYTSHEGQLKAKLGKCKRFVWTLLLEDDDELMAEYKNVHSIGQAWPQITKNMKQVGVKDMEIYLNSNRAILIMDTCPEFDLEKVGPVWQNLPQENEWQEYVSKFQRINPESSIQEKWLDMNKIELEN